MPLLKTKHCRPRVDGKHQVIQSDFPSRKVQLPHRLPIVTITTRILPRHEYCRTRPKPDQAGDVHMPPVVSSVVWFAQNAQYIVCLVFLLHINHRVVYVSDSAFQ